METDMRIAKLGVVAVLTSVVVGCAAIGTEYVKVYDRKYNEYRLVQKPDPGTFVGTSAAQPAARAPGQHP